MLKKIFIIFTTILFLLIPYANARQTSTIVCKHPRHGEYTFMIHNTVESTVFLDKEMRQGKPAEWERLGTTYTFKINMPDKKTGLPVEWTWTADLKKNKGSLSLNFEGKEIKKIKKLKCTYEDF
jgi:hypothetical protein